VKRRNQAHLFAAENSYFQPPKSENSPRQKSNTRKSYSLAQAIEDYKLRGKVEGRAEKTLEQYDYVLGRLTEKFNKSVEVDSIETREIRNYLAYLMDEGLSNTTVAIHYRVLQAFFNWLVKEGYATESPIADIKQPKPRINFQKY